MSVNVKKPNVPYAVEQGAVMSEKAEGGLSERITDYLSGGGLFNPELANHDAVRDLLIDCRGALQSLSPEREAVIEECARVCEATERAVSKHYDNNGGEDKRGVAAECAEAIRALKPAAGNEGMVPHLMECGDIVPALENLLTTQAAYALQDGTSRAQRDVARKAFDAELESYLKFRLREVGRER